MTRHRTSVVALAAAFIAAFLLAQHSCKSTKHPVPHPTLGGGVNGLVCVIVPAAGPGSKVKTIPVPDIKVLLRNIASGNDSAPVSTDLFGRYLFPRQHVGTYQLHWEAQGGWAAGTNPDKIVVTANTQYPRPSRIVPDERNGLIFGRVTFADGSSPWFYDELFASNKTAEVAVLNMAANQTVAGPVRTNVTGQYAVAGLARGATFTLRAKSESSTATRIAAASAVSFGQPVLSQDLELPNHRPEVLAIVPELGGSPIETAPSGTTITLDARTTDAEGDALNLQWKLLVGSGTIVPSGTTAKWTLPGGSGIYSAFLQVKDGRGGYARKQLDFHVGKTHARFSGQAVDDGGAPVKSASVTVGTASTTTDANGFFDVSAPLTKRYVLNIYKQGYALVSRVLDTDTTGQTWILVKAVESTVDPKAPIVLTDKRPVLDRKKLKGAIVRLPADALVDANGTKPSGPLKAYFATLDVGGAQGPGDWGAINGAGKETNLLSLGAVFVEFVDASGTKFNQLASGLAAETEMFPPPFMLPGAPANAQMWSYDEKDGFWKESGPATFNSTTKSFHGKVTHFSTINTDIEKVNAACLKVLLYPPIPTNVRLHVTDAGPGGGADFAQAFDKPMDSALNAVLRLPADTDVKLELFDSDNVTPLEGLVYQDDLGNEFPGGIVNSGGATTPTLPEEPYENCKLVVVRFLDGQKDDVFLTRMGEGSAALADQYYGQVDPDDLRTNLGAWWAINKFDFGGDGFQAKDVPTNSTRTSYLNNNDLGSGRDMHFRVRDDGGLAAYVTNYGKFNQDDGNADLARDRTDPGATVCMEYAPIEQGQPTRIVKFFVFAFPSEDLDGDGLVTEADSPRQPGAALDDYDVKFVPNLCITCHGGDVYSAGSQGNVRASFRELDVSTYRYPGHRGPELITNDELTAFRQQNEMIKNAAQVGSAAEPAIARPAIKELITNWYNATSDIQHNEWRPGGWGPDGSKSATLYDNIVKASCRTCHIALLSDDVATGKNFVTYDQLKTYRGYGDFLRDFILCGDGRQMPHAAVTYRQFWLSANPHRPGFLRNYDDGADWPQIGVCPP